MEGAISSPQYARIAVVTGGNKGIGLAVCRQLASNGVMVILTARDEKRGAEAFEKLKSLGLPNVIFHQLDITDASSIDRLADFLKSRFGKLDILVNNAGIDGFSHDPADSLALPEEVFKGMDANQTLEWVGKNSQETYDTTEECVKTNYFGTKHVTEVLLPLLQSSSDGRIVNVSSNFGRLRLFHSEEMKRELDDVDNLNEKRLDELVGLFLQDFKAGAVEARGWPILFSAYKVAKSALNAYTRLLARRHPALRVNCVHPGYVKTDISRHTGILTPEEGASNVVRLALLPDGGPTGAFFDHAVEAPFV